MATAPTSTGDGGSGDGKGAGACDYLYTLNGKPLDGGVLCASGAREAREELRRAARRLAAGALGGGGGGGGSACGGHRHDENTAAPENDAETTEISGRATRTVDECLADDLLAHCEAVEASECVWSEEVAACGAGAAGRLVEHRVHEQVWRERHTRAPYAHQVRGAVRREHGWLVQDVDVPIDCAAHARWYEGGDDAASGIEICLWRGAGERRRALFRCFLPADFASFLCEQGDAPFFGLAAPPPPPPSAGTRRRYYTYHMDDPLVLHFSSDCDGVAHDGCDDVAPAGGVRDYEATKRATEKLSQRISLVRISFPDPQRLGEAHTHAHAMPRQHLGHAEAAEAAAVAQRRASDRVVRWRADDDTVRRRQQCAASRRRRLRARPPYEAGSAAPRAPPASAPTAVLRTRMLERLPPLPVWQQEELVDFLAAATASPKSNAGTVDGDVLDYLQNYDGLETAVRRGKEAAAAPPPKSPGGICEPFSRLSLADGVQGPRAMARACV